MRKTVSLLLLALVLTTACSNKQPAGVETSGAVQTTPVATGEATQSITTAEAERNDDDYELFINIESHFVDENTFDIASFMADLGFTEQAKPTDEYDGGFLSFIHESDKDEATTFRFFISYGKSSTEPERNEDYVEIMIRVGSYIADISLAEPTTTDKTTFAGKFNDQPPINRESLMKVLRAIERIYYNKQHGLEPIRGADTILLG